MSQIKNYTKEVETLFIQMMLSEPELYIRVKGILSNTYFVDPNNVKVVKFLESYSDERVILPSYEQIKAITGIEIEPLGQLEQEHKEWFLDEFELFCRHKAIALEVHASIDLVDEKRYGEVEANIKRAVQIGLIKDLGTNYFKNPHARLTEIKNTRAMQSTGWRDVDLKLYGGMNRGELTIFAGQPGAGKSLFLQNLGLNWVEQGLNVVYITLELSEKLTSMRIDAMITDCETREVLKNIDEVSMKIKKFSKNTKGGNLQLKYLNNGSTAHDIRAYVREVEIQTGRKVDACLIDYLDLCSPCSKRVRPDDMFIKDKYVSEELRGVAVELDILMATASQLNRSSFDQLELDASHIAGGISKVNTADNMIAITTSKALKDEGKYQIQFIKTRSSSGVGHRIELAFSKRSLRIFDMPEGHNDREDIIKQHDTDAVIAKISGRTIKNSDKDTRTLDSLHPEDILTRGLDLFNRHRDDD